MTRKTLAAALSASILAFGVPLAIAAQDAGTGQGHHAGAMSQDDYQNWMHEMQELHQQMANAKTPDERAKLMDEHREAMQKGMGMMNHMANTRGMSRDQRMHMMENRMNMMNMMMQMMMDRQGMMGGMGGMGGGKGGGMGDDHMGTDSDK